LDARALACDKEQQFSMADVVLPDPGEHDLVVRTLCSGVSVGTEFALIRGDLSWGPYPLCTGYQGVGVVERSGMEAFGAGDLVYYRHNRRIRLPDGQPVSSVSGVHCSRAVIDTSDDPQVARLPEGVEPDVGSLFVMPAVGLHGVDMANPRTGQVVVVHGVGLIGLGVVAACAQRGCVVVAVDMLPERLEVAGRLGAEHLVRADEGDVADAVHDLAPGGAHVVFECTGRPQCLDAAIALCRRFGTFVLQGNYGAAPVSWHFLPAHGRQLTMLFPCDDGGPDCRRAVLANMASGALAWDETVTHRVPAAEAADFYRRIGEGAVEGLVGAVIRWEEDEA
jgi:2-desacetyl-2-hydroxyethyl bacteriochlorophyllide A dehydrogenase